MHMDSLNINKALISEYGSLPEKIINKKGWERGSQGM